MRPHPLPAGKLCIPAQFGFRVLGFTPGLRFWARALYLQVLAGVGPVLGFVGLGRSAFELVQIWPHGAKDSAAQV